MVIKKGVTMPLLQERHQVWAVAELSADMA